MNKIMEIKFLDGYKILIKFNDGLEKVVDFKPFLGKGFTAELLDMEKFKQASIEEGGGIGWPNGYDFCPNYLHELEGEIRKNVA